MHTRVRMVQPRYLFQPDWPLHPQSYWLLYWKITSTADWCVMVYSKLNLGSEVLISQECCLGGRRLTVDHDQSRNSFWTWETHSRHITTGPVTKSTTTEEKTSLPYPLAMEKEIFRRKKQSLLKASLSKPLSDWYLGSCIRKWISQRNLCLHQKPEVNSALILGHLFLF